MRCPSLTDPNDGVMNCSFTNNGDASYEDICSFTCNTGYELTGNDTRNCQSDRSWSGTESICSRGMHACAFMLVFFVSNYLL